MELDMKSLFDVIGAGTQTAAVSDTWGLWSATKPEFESHYIFKCLGKRNCQEGTIWNLQGDEEDFSWYLESVGKDDLLPKKKQELSDQVLLLIQNDQKWRTANEIALAIGSNPEHTRRICKKLFLEGEIAREKRLQTEGDHFGFTGQRLFLHRGSSKKHNTNHDRTNYFFWFVNLITRFKGLGKKG